MKPGTDMMSLTEFCSTTGIGRNVGYNAVNAGKIPHIRVGKRILISRKVVAEMLDPLAATNGQKVQPSPKTPDRQLPPVRRGGARLSTEKFNEFNSVVDALRAALQGIGDLVMRLRIIQEDLERNQK